MKVVILSGGFDPLHSGHIEMMENAKRLGGFLVVCLNSDEWLVKKKGINFLPIKERMNIIKNISYVDDVITFEDDEYGSAVNGIKAVVEKYTNHFKDYTYISDGEIYTEQLLETQFAFGNGGDRKANSTPSIEQVYCEENGIELLWNLGGDKSNSSSWILNRYRNWHFEMEERVWGNYKVIYQDAYKKVKVIEVMPHKALSLQSHDHRSEHWTVVEGIATVILEEDKYKLEKIIERNESIYIPVKAKHKLINNTDDVLQIIEVQIGEYLKEDDITRYD